MSYAKALELDRLDPLADFRGQFHLPEGKIYFDGNSLGLMPLRAEAEVLEALEQWKRLAIDGWLAAEKPWFHRAEELGAMAAGLVGALPEEVVATGAITQNLHALLATFYRPQGGRRKILADRLTFPSDLYAIAQFMRMMGADPERDLLLAGREDSPLLDEAEVEALMGEEVALALLPTVLYRSGQLLDVGRLTRAGHAHGIVMGFDAAHSAGAVPHHFHEQGVDFAVWCGYKHLNGGPGATGFLYLHERHFDREPLLAGWFGYQKDRQFDMSLEFRHQRAASGWQISTPNILSLAALRGALSVSLEAGIEAIRRKSLALTDYLWERVEQELSAEPYGFGLASPREHARRGGHLALTHPTEAWRISQALKARGVVPDFRHPNIIRLAPVALYNRFEEVERVVQALKEVVDGQEHLRFSTRVAAVS